MTAFAETASIKKSAKAAEIDKVQHYRWLESDPEYAAEFERVRAIAAQALEDEAVRRAHQGVLKPVLWQGRPQFEIVRDPKTGQIRGQRPIVIREYSDTLLGLLLKAWMPKKYRENINAEVTTTTRRFSGTLEELLAIYNQVQAPDGE